MKAWVWEGSGEKPMLQTLSKPEPGPNEILVRVEATLITSYLSSLIDGTGGFETPPMPFTPGSEATGTVEAVGRNCRHLDVGTRVYCDPLVEARLPDGELECAFMGGFPITPGGQFVLKAWPNGTLASHVLMPAGSVTSIEPALEKVSLQTLTRMGWLGTAYAGLIRSGFQTGDRVAVTGATGILGSSAVLIALAMGASHVLAIARKEQKLEPLATLDARVETTTRVPQGYSADSVLCCAAAGGPEIVEELLEGLRQRGTVVMLASLDPAPRAKNIILSERTIKGSIWFPRDVPSRLVRLIETGQLDLHAIESDTYPLQAVEAALHAATAGVNALRQVVVCPEASP